MRNAELRRELLRTQHGQCGICDEPCHEADATLDHLVPVAWGGTRQGRTNVRVAHYKCNQKRKHFVTEEELALGTSPGSTPVRSKDWIQRMLLITILHTALFRPFGNHRKKDRWSAVFRKALQTSLFGPISLL